MSSPSPVQLLSPNIVQLIVCHVVGSSRQVFANVLANSNEQNKLLKLLLWIGHNFCAIAYPLYCNHFKLGPVGPEYHKCSIYNQLIYPCDPSYHMRNDLGYPIHYLAKKLINGRHEQAVYTGEALEALMNAPYEGCAFPLVRCITFNYMMYKPTEYDTPSPPESEANISVLVE
ncbi:hypothetical protein GGI09_004636 [Coemansia sp. S100]|nr:hypothetical protein LPJ71_000708 [Coemansia sp. S17]KAJ2095916.1 hypothetical protein GGI09_004636 [Coemansia sp. S100]